jgi:hypothetical protein
LILLDSLSYPNALSSVLERVLGTLQSSPGVEKWRCPSDINNAFFNILKLKALNFHGVSQLFGDWLASQEGQVWKSLSGPIIWVGSTYLGNEQTWFVAINVF